MNTDSEILSILNELLNTNSNEVLKRSMTYKQALNQKVCELLSVRPEEWNQTQIVIVKDTLNLSNILYNNSDLDILILEDGVYDLLLEAYKRVSDVIPVGAIPVNIQSSNKEIESIPREEMIMPVRILTEEEKQKISDMLYPEIINDRKQLTREDLRFEPVRIIDTSYISRREKNIKHEHPELVGTLDKCKYVLNVQAEEMGVLNDTNVKVLERDWLFPMLGRVFNQNDTIDIIAELKYDGVSVEADVTDVVLSARSRGDTELDETTDLTPILAGYRFPNAPKLDKPIGMKFEAIMTYSDLNKFNQMKGYNYKNGRTAIIALFHSSDAYLYRDLITLIPLQTDIKGDDKEPIDRLVEIEFLNKYYTRFQLLRFSVLSGNYVSILFQIKKYVEDAEFARSYIPFMYDGVVLEFYDANIRKLLGRVNSVNKYAMAVKFNALKKQTIFRGYKYTVGQNGVITPMIYYDPVEFFGTIHPKSTGNSYQRFCNLDLRIGDIIDVTYVNDVITRVTKPDNIHNRKNASKPLLPEETFPTKCPSCGTQLIFSKDSARCPNLYCRERNIKRIASAVNKLGFKDIAEERLEILGFTKLKDLFNASLYDLSIIGETNAMNLYSQIQNILNHPIEDYRIFGALGFSNIGAKKWSAIFDCISVDELMEFSQTPNFGIQILNRIPGNWKKTVDIIVQEFPFFQEDIYFILQNFTLISTKGNSCTKKEKVRFTGFRDKELVRKLQELGYDADDNEGVTKDTSILVIPYPGYNQGNKMKKAIQYGISIIPVNQLKIELSL